MSQPSCLAWAFLAAMTLNGTAGAAGQDATSTTFAPELSILFGHEYRIDTTLQRLPSAHAIGTLLDHVAHPAVYQIEESAGFSDIDAKKFSLYGDSWVWNRWTLDEFDITDPLFAGTAAFEVPFRFLAAFGLRNNEGATTIRGGGVALSARGLPVDGHARTLGLRTVIPEAGGIWPAAISLGDWFSGTHSMRRIIPPPQQRRGFRRAFDGYYLEDYADDFITASYALDIKSGQRSFLAFSPINDPDEPRNPFRGTFEEDFVQVSTIVKVAPWRANYVGYVQAQYLDRSALGAEMRLSPDETAHMRAVSLWGGAAWKNFQTGLLIKQYEIAPNRIDFVRDLRDADGEGDPFAPGGSYLALQSDALYRAGMVYAAAAHSGTRFEPAARHWSNNLTFQGAPYGRYDWSSAPTSHWLGDDRAGVRGKRLFGQWNLNYDAYAWGAYGLNGTGKNGLYFADLGARSSLERIGGAVRPFAVVAKSPLPVTPNLVQTLDPRYLNGIQSVGDEGSVFDTIGGNSIRVDRTLWPANSYALATGFGVPFGSVWTANVQLIGKVFHNTYRIAYDGPASRYGAYRDGVFFGSEGAKKYVLENRPAGSMADIPMYYGAHVQIQTVGTERAVFSISTSAFNVIGDAAIGNGPDASDLGVVRFADASPNARVKGLGALDSDRAYMVRALGGVEPAPDFWCWVTIAHRDGTPFAFYDFVTDDVTGQVAQTYVTSRGAAASPAGKFGGPREDFHLNVDVQLEYLWQIDALLLRTFLMIANALDLGDELGEPQNAWGQHERVSLESEIPRSVTIGVELIDF